MRKEVIFAVIAGSLVGIIIAFGVWRANQAINSNKTTTNSTSVETNPEEPTTTPTPETGLAIASPSDNALLVNTPVTINGLAKAGSIIALSAEDKDYIALADTNGSFTLDVDLNAGVNQIKVYSFDKTGIKNEKDLTLVYSSEFSKSTLSTTPTPSPVLTKTSANPTVASDSVREIVKEKVQEKANSPVAYIGTVTDISVSTLEIKSAAGEVKQISADKDLTTFINAINAPKEVKLADLAIGNFIVAMGYKNNNEVLAAKRIIIIKTLKPTLRMVTYGVVTSTLKTSLTIKNISNQEVTTIVSASVVTINSLVNDKLTKIKLSDINTNDIVIAFGQTADTGFEARRITVIPAPTATPTPSPSPTTKAAKATPTPKPTTTPKPTITPTPGAF